MLSRAARPYSPAGKARSDLPGIGEDARYNQGRSARQQIDYENDPAVQEGQAPEEGVDKSSAMRILAAASAIHTAACLLNGFGNPDEGDGLTQGAGVFQDASVILGAAGSDPGWHGAGAQTYERRNSEPAYGPAVSQAATAIACLGADTGLQTQQGKRSQKTGAAIDAVASRYGQIADT